MAIQPPDPAAIPRSLRRGPLVMVLFWLVVMGVVYAAIKTFMQPSQVTVAMNGEMTIARARDGHFYAPGSIDGQPVVFLVDTGASYVTVSREFARRAGMSGGQRAQFQTASGVMEGAIVDNQTVALGPAQVSGIKVAVGLAGAAPDMALLGQSFLAHFQITLSGDRMVLRRL